MEKLNLMKKFLMTVLVVAHGSSVYAGNDTRSVSVSTSPVTGALTK